MKIKYLEYKELRLNFPCYLDLKYSQKFKFIPTRFRR